MRRLSTQIYIVIVVSLLLVAIVAALFWRRGPDRGAVRQAFDVVAELASVSLAPASAPVAQQVEALEHLGARLKLNLAVFDADRRLVAEHRRGPPLPAPPDSREDSGWIFGPGGPAWAIELPDSRWLVARSQRRRPLHPAVSALGFLGIISLAVALSAWPVVRGLTRRLERLQGAVEQLGHGNLKSRVPVEGRDEVAKLAQSFNRSAERIEELVGAHKLLLANASHELRTPLSRIRLGIELMKGGADEARHAALQKDIAELDQLIDEILLASRLDALERPERTEAVDILALAAEEAARYDDTSVGGEPLVVPGDARLLRRLVRNLIENASRHGRPPIDITVTRQDGVALLRVADGGAGIPVTDAERIFEPFRRGRPEDGTGPQAGSSASGDRTGTGLGLALVRQIARRHGGEAWLETAPGSLRSSRFSVRLPLAGLDPG